MRASIAPRLCLLLLGIAPPAMAAWPNDPLVNVPLCTAAGRQQVPMSASDGAGGAIVTWYDLRSGNNDIYARRVLGSGVVDPAWPAQGRALCTAAGNQQNPTIVSDGSGGAIVTWYDRRSGTDYDIYAQHVLSSGAVDPAWPVDGVAVCAATSDQFLPTISSDETGGAVISWYDFRSGGLDANIYAQRVLASGVVDPAWPADGTALCTASGVQSNQRIVSDGAGGAIVTWYDPRSGTDFDIYAQRVLSDGTLHSDWPADGRVLCLGLGEQSDPEICSDGTSGAIVTWNDNRNVGDVDIYAQHVYENGKVDTAWPLDGQLLCGAADQQAVPAIVSDGVGGAIVTWRDFRGGGAYDIYAQRVRATGEVDPAWPADGLEVCGATGDQMDPTITTDTDGGAVITWYDFRSGTSFDIYAQRVLSYGVAEPSWPANGAAISTAPNAQAFPMIVSDGSGGAVIAWQDSRAGGTAYDIYAQGVDRYGTLGPPTVAVEERPASLELALARPTPNPASVPTTLSFELPRTARVRLGIYDAGGRMVRELMNGSRVAGRHETRWDLRAADGGAVSPGLYFARIESGGRSVVRRIAVTR